MLKCQLVFYRMRIAMQSEWDTLPISVAILVVEVGGVVAVAVVAVQIAWDDKG